MRDLYKNYKYKIGDKMWTCRDERPIQCEITDKVPGFLGTRAYIVLPEGQNEHTKVYESDMFATKEELCLHRIKQYEDEIQKLDQDIIGMKALKAKWEAFKGEAK